MKHFERIGVQLYPLFMVSCQPYSIDLLDKATVKVSMTASSKRVPPCGYLMTVSVY